MLERFVCTSVRVLQMVDQSGLSRLVGLRPVEFVDTIAVCFLCRTLWRLYDVLQILTASDIFITAIVVFLSISYQHIQTKSCCVRYMYLLYKYLQVSPHQHYVYPVMRKPLAYAKEKKHSKNRNASEANIYVYELACASSVASVNRYLFLFSPN